MANLNTIQIDGALPSRVYNKVYQKAQLLKESELATTLETEKIEYGLGILEVLLAANFLFELFNASALNIIAKLVSAVTFLFITPFLSIYGKEPSFALSRVELATLTGMIVYPIIAWAIIAMVRVNRKKQAAEAELFTYNPTL